MITGQQYVYSHMREWYPWYSEAFDRKIKKLLPEFDIKEIKFGDKCQYQMSLENGHVTIGCVEAVYDKFDSRSCFHEHVVDLKTADYLNYVSNLKTFWSAANIKYDDFVKSYQPGDTLKTWELNIEPGKRNLQLSILKISKTELENILHSLFSLFALEPVQKSLSWEVPDINEALEIMSTIFSILPAELCPYISFFAGNMYPQNAGYFKVWIRIRAGQRKLVSQNTGSTGINEIFSRDLAEAAFAGNESNLDACHRRFSEICKQLGGISGGQNFIVSALSVYTTPNKFTDILKTSIDKHLQSDDFRSAEEYFPANSLTKNDIVEANKYIKTVLETRIQNLINQNNEKALKLAEGLTRVLAAKFADAGLSQEAKFSQLITGKLQEHQFLAHVLAGHAQEALQVFSKENAVARIESLLQSGTIDGSYLSYFFAQTSDKFTFYIDKKKHPLIWAAFGDIYRQNLIKNITLDTLRKNPYYVRESIDGLQETGGGSTPAVESKNNVSPGLSDETITNLVNAVMYNLTAFNSESELELLINPSNINPSMLQKFTEVILSLEGVILTSQLKKMATTYFKKLNDSIVEHERSKAIFSKNDFRPGKGALVFKYKDKERRQKILTALIELGRNLSRMRKFLSPLSSEEIQAILQRKNDKEIQQIDENALAFEEIKYVLTKEVLGIIPKEQNADNTEHPITNLQSENIQKDKSSSSRLGNFAHKIIPMNSGYEKVPQVKKITKIPDQTPQQPVNISKNQPIPAENVEANTYKKTLSVQSWIKDINNKYVLVEYKTNEDILRNSGQLNNGIIDIGPKLAIFLASSVLFQQKYGPNWKVMDIRLEKNDKDQYIYKITYGQEGFSLVVIIGSIGQLTP
jgi:hypothetical protein